MIVVYLLKVFLIVYAIDQNDNMSFGLFHIALDHHQLKRVPCFSLYQLMWLLLTPRLLKSACLTMTHLFHIIMLSTV